MDGPEGGGDAHLERWRMFSQAEQSQGGTDAKVARHLRPHSSVTLCRSEHRIVCAHVPRAAGSHCLLRHRFPGLFRAVFPHFSSCCSSFVPARAF